LGEPLRETKRITVSTLLTTVALVAVIQAGSLCIMFQNMPVYIAVVSSSGTTANIAGTAGLSASSPAGTGVDILFLLGIVFAVTLLLLWLVRHKLVFSFKLLIFGAMALAAFFLTLVTADTFAYNYLPQALEVPVSVAASVGVVVVIGYTIFVRSHPWISNTIIAFVGAEVGSFFAGTLSPVGSFPWMALLLPLAFSVYDVYAVFRGPLKYLVGTAPKLTLNGMSVRLGEFTLGLGDIVFYTMLPCVSLLYVSYARNYAAGIFASLVTMVAIDAGVAFTLYLLSKRRLLPGLPIPMLLGVAVAVAFLV
jgi:hypothetical protein